MKKVVILTVLVCLSLNISAQIQRTFFGLELGKSTSEQVFESLKDKDAFYETLNGEKSIIVKNTRFGGYEWDYAIFSFYNNLLTSVLFEDFNNPNSGDRYDKIIYTIYPKYREYIKKFTPDTQSYKDDRTILIINKEKDNVSMMYSDIELYDEQSVNERNEF